MLPAHVLHTLPKLNHALSEVVFAAGAPSLLLLLFVLVSEEILYFHWKKQCHIPWTIHSYCAKPLGIDFDCNTTDVFPSESYGANRNCKNSNRVLFLYFFQR